MRVLTLDDMDNRQREFERWFKDHDHVKAYTSCEAIRKIDEEERFNVIHLDHDLAEIHYVEQTGSFVEGTGMDVVNHIITLPPEKRPDICIVHSWNKGRAHEMTLRLREAGIQTYNRQFNVSSPTILVENKEK